MSDGPVDREKQRDREQELASKVVDIESKRFQIDVKQNQRGRFIKIAETLLPEKETNGKPRRPNRKNRLLLPMSTALEFRDNLNEFIEYDSKLGAAKETSPTDDSKLKSATLAKDNRRYYLDLKENTRGRFLRVSQTVPRSNMRSQIAVPSNGMKLIGDLITEFLNDFGSDDLSNNETGGDVKAPKSRTVKADQKLFYFDVGKNRRGVYMRISEVRPSLRTSITLPDTCWEEFRDALDEFVNERNADLATITDEGDDNKESNSGKDQAEGN